MKKNICGNILAEPVNTQDDELMVREKLRNPLRMKIVFHNTPVEKMELKRAKKKVEPFKGKTIYHNKF